MPNNERALALLKELESECGATRKCLQRMRMERVDFQPDPTSMKMGYMAILIASMPLWIHTMVVKSELDLATFPHPKLKTTDDLVEYFDANMDAARNALAETDDDHLRQPFSLKRNGEELYTTLKILDIPVTINHLVHHRGQFTVYMRMNGLSVPALYGPSADDRRFVAPK
ncbi:MAG: damage-inducible protein DinB [Sphingobacteriales bacterium]|nr:MAG: damage-inducible protein DinB [Sphingobacteriales bacterium]